MRRRTASPVATSISSEPPWTTHSRVSDRASASRPASGVRRDCGGRLPHLGALRDASIVCLAGGGCETVQESSTRSRGTPVRAPRAGRLLLLRALIVWTRRRAARGRDDLARRAALQHLPACRAAVRNRRVCVWCLANDVVIAPRSRSWPLCASGQRPGGETSARPGRGSPRCCPVQVRPGCAQADDHVGRVG